MRCAIIDNDLVINIAEADLDFASQMGWIPSDVANIGDSYKDGEFVKHPVPEKPIEQLQKEIIDSTQHRLDNFAKTRNYDGILSACTYATSTVSKFQSEGQYCVNARDATWATLYQLFDDVTNGIKPMPQSFADVEPLLPELVWPNEAAPA